MKRQAKVIVIGLVMALFLVGCTNKEGPYKVDLIVKSVDSDFWKSLYKGASAAASKYNVEISYSGPIEEGDYKEQPAIFYKKLEDNPDAIILAAGDYYLMEQPINEAQMPIIMVDSLANGNKWENFIATDNYQVGVDLAKEVINRYGKTGQVGVINFVKGTSTAMAREAGLLATLEKESKLEVLDVLYCEANIETAKKQTLQLLMNHPDLEVMIGLNAQCSVGIARAIKEIENDRVFVAGVDCILEEADAIESGILKVTILQNPYMMGYYSVESAYQAITGEKTENKYVDTYIIDKESLFSKESQELIFPFE